MSDFITYPPIKVHVLHDRKYGRATAQIRSFSEPGKAAFELDAQVLVNGMSVAEKTYPLTGSPKQRTAALCEAAKWVNSTAKQTDRKTR